jgi:hypothetical protein
MTLDEFAKTLALSLQEEAEVHRKKIKDGESNGFTALVDATICATLDRVSECVLDASIERIGKRKI